MISYRTAKGLLVALLVALIPAAAGAQGSGSGFYPPQQAGAGGGPFFGLRSISLPDVDERFASMGLGSLPEWVNTWGGWGGFHAGTILIGVTGYGGRQTVGGEQGGIEREGEVELSTIGLTLGYVKAIGRMKLTLGTTLGAESLSIRLRRSPSGSADWDGVWSWYETGLTGTVDAADLDITTRLEGSGFWAEPFISMRWWVIPLVAVDLGVFYSWGSIGAGKLEVDGRKVDGSPKLDLSGTGFRLGVFLGF